MLRAKAKLDGEATEQITIPAMNLQEMTVFIEGVTPLLQNGWTEQAIEEMEAPQRGVAKGPKKFREPDKEWVGHLHVLDAEEEVYGHPASGIKKALVVAGGRFADGIMTHLRGILNIPAELVEIKGDKPRMRRDIGVLKNGTPMTVYRPEFLNWSMEVPVVYNASKISDQQILNLFQIAGFSVGIGAFRPERSGTFGQFKVVRMG